LSYLIKGYLNINSPSEERDLIDPYPSELIPLSDAFAPEVEEGDGDTDENENGDSEEEEQAVEIELEYLKDDEDLPKITMSL